MEIRGSSIWITGLSQSFNTCATALLLSPDQLMKTFILKAPVAQPHWPSVAAALEIANPLNESRHEAGELILHPLANTTALG